MDYGDKVLELANHRGWMSYLRGDLRNSTQKSLLVKADIFTRHLGDACRTWQTER